MSRPSSWIAVALVGLLPSLSLKAADWPGFRGPNRDGLSADSGLLKEWPKDGPALLWKATDLGAGFSSVAIAGDRVFSMGDREDGCYLFALKRSDGKPLWSLKVGKTGGNYVGPRCTPSVDGKHVYALGQFGDLVCAEADSGKEVWRKSLTKDFKGSPGGWDYTESPLIDGNRLICTPGGRDATMLALDKKDGEVIWKGAVPGGEGAGYSSIVAADIAGVRQYVQLMSQGVASFAARDGKLLWRYGTARDRFGNNTANIPTPIVKGDLVFCSAGYGRGGGLVRVSQNQGTFEAEELWFKSELNNKHGGVVLVGEHLYGDHDSSGRPWCADFKTGKVVWRREGRGEGSGSASLVHADGHLYIHYDNGYVALVPAAPKGKYQEKGVFKIPNSDRDSWAHPVVLDGRLYLREQDTLWVYDVKGR